MPKTKRKKQIRDYILEKQNRNNPASDVYTCVFPIARLKFMSRLRHHAMAGSKSQNQTDPQMPLTKCILIYLGMLHDGPYISPMLKTCGIIQFFGFAATFSESDRRVEANVQNITPAWTSNRMHQRAPFMSLAKTNA